MGKVEQTIIMTAEELKNKIQQRGYWKITFHPKKAIPNLIPSRSDLEEILRRSQIRLRGWYYPHIPSNNDERQAMYCGQNYLESFNDFGKHKEIFRFYQSGQFVNYMAVEEDWIKEDGWAPQELKEKYKPGQILEVINTIWTLTEIFEFAKRLSEHGIFDSGIHIAIKLFKTKGRVLKILDFNRAPLFGEYKAHIDTIELPPPNLRDLTKEDIKLRSKEIALECIKDLFDIFGWKNQPVDMFKSDQERLLQRRF